MIMICYVAVALAGSCLLPTPSGQAPLPGGARVIPVQEIKGGATNLYLRDATMASLIRWIKQLTPGRTTNAQRAHSARPTQEQPEPFLSSLLRAPKCFHLGSHTGCRRLQEGCEACCRKVDTTSNHY